MGTFGGDRRSAPHKVYTVVGPATVEVVGAPQYISVKAQGGDAEVLMVGANPGTASAGEGWLISDGETVDWLVSDTNRYLQVISGTIRYHKS